jgi:thiol-disulfide isomerase/thioredoxin
MVRTHNLFCRAFASLVAFGSACGATAGGGYAPLGAGQGQELPNIRYFDAESQGHKLDPSGNQLTILHFWATWCVPCIKELPEVDKIAGRYLDNNVQVLALSLDGQDLQKVQDFYRSHNILYLRPFRDDRNAALRAINGSALPITVFIDRKGRVIGRVDGALDWESPQMRQFFGLHLAP